MSCSRWGIDLFVNATDLSASKSFERAEALSSNWTMTSAAPFEATRPGWMVMLMTYRDQKTNTASFSSSIKRAGVGAAMFLALLCMVASPAVAAEPAGADNFGVSSATSTRTTGLTKHSGKRATKRSRTRRTRRTSRRQGAYFTGGLGLVSVTDQSRELDLEDGTGINLGLGFRLTPDLALEGRFVGSLHDAEGRGSNESSLTGGSVNLKYFFPLGSNRLEAFAEGGLGLMNIEGENEEVESTFFDLGGGFDYRLTRETALGAKANFTNFFGEDSSDDEVDLNTFTLMATISVQL
jgi:opacity protein-like surface antigen